MTLVYSEDNLELWGFWGVHHGFLHRLGLHHQDAQSRWEEGLYRNHSSRDIHGIILTTNSASTWKKANISTILWLMGGWGLHQTSLLQWTRSSALWTTWKSISSWSIKLRLNTRTMLKVPLTAWLQKTPGATATSTSSARTPAPPCSPPRRTSPSTWTTTPPSSSTTSTLPKSLAASRKPGTSQGQVDVWWAATSSSALARRTWARTAACWCRWWGRAARSTSHIECTYLTSKVIWEDLSLITIREIYRLE